MSQMLFQKYDVDRDGLLNRDEVRMFAKGEFDFDLPVDTLDRIWRTIKPENSPGGLPVDSVSRLKTALGIAKEQKQAQPPPPPMGQGWGGFGGVPPPPAYGMGLGVPGTTSLAK